MILIIKDMNKKHYIIYINLIMNTIFMHLRFMIIHIRRFYVIEKKDFE